MIVSDERVALFVSDILGFSLCPPWACLGIERNGKITAGVLFNQFEGCNVHVTVAGKGWTRAFLEAVGEYVFGQLGCLRMTVTTEQTGVAKLAIKFGGNVEGYMRDHFGYGRDACIIGILRAEYRYSKRNAKTARLMSSRAQKGQDVEDTQGS